MTAADDRAIGDGDASWHRGHAICSTSFVLGAEGVSTLAHFFEVSVGGCPRGSLFYRRFLRRSRTPSGRPSDAIPSRDTACSTSPWCEALSAAKWSWANGIHRIRAGQHKWPGPGRQIAELQAAGCAKIYREKVSGAKTDRRELARLLRAIEPGDMLIVSRLDRLARSTRDLLNILDAVAKAGAGFRSLKDAWADTTTAHGQLMLTVLGGLAEFERSLIVARTGEGRERAKARGVRFGRPSNLSAFQRQEAVRRHAAGEAAADIARSFNCHRASIYRALAAD